MEPLTMSLLLGGGASLIGGIGNIFANMSAAERQKALQDESMQEYLKINIPNEQERALALDQLQSQGTLSPELESAISQGASEFNKVRADSGQKGVQNRALMQLEDLSNQGGMNLEDKAALQDEMLKVQAQNRGNQAAIASEMAQRGTGGSGFDLQARLANQQAMGDQNSKNSLSIAAQAQRRALDAMQGAGQLATQYRTQDVNEQQARAQAQDAINRFNTGNLQSVNASNVGIRNRAAEQNLANAQRIADQNVGIRNDQQRSNAGLAQRNAQQAYQNQMGMAGAKAGVRGQQAAQAGQQGQMIGNAYSNIGQGVKDTSIALADPDFWKEYTKSKAKGG